MTRPRDQETANRYENKDCVNSLVHGLAFCIDICFGSETTPHLDAALCIDASLCSPTAPHASAPPPASLASL